MVLALQVRLGGKFSSSVCVLRLEALYQCESGIWESNERTLWFLEISFSHGDFRKCRIWRSSDAREERRSKFDFFFLLLLLLSGSTGPWLVATKMGV